MALNRYQVVCGVCGDVEISHTMGEAVIAVVHHSTCGDKKCQSTVSVGGVVAACDNPSGHESSHHAILSAWLMNANHDVTLVWGGDHDV